MGIWSNRRTLKKKVNSEVKASKEKLTRAELEERKENIENEQVVEQQVDENDIDKSYTPRRSLIHVMGSIYLTCDAKNTSVRDCISVAASVVNALGPSLGINLDDTNVNKSRAWRKGQKMRPQKSKQIREEFTRSDKVVVHWDGKTLVLTLRGNTKSTRICVYLSGVDAEQTRKLLEIPEAKSGKNRGRNAYCHQSNVPPQTEVCPLPWLPWLEDLRTREHHPSYRRLPLKS